MLFPGAASVGTVFELGTVGSTFDAVDERADHLTTWATLDQRAGRGRLGREWVSPAGKCLAATMLVRTKGLRDDADPYTGVIVILLERKHDAWLAKWSGADAWFVKPVDPFELADRLLDLVTEKESA